MRMYVVKTLPFGHLTDYPIEIEMAHPVPGVASVRCRLDAAEARQLAADLLAAAEGDEQ